LLAPWDQKLRSNRLDLLLIIEGDLNNAIKVQFKPFLCNTLKLRKTFQLFFL
jgi:hypothetical protein